MNIRYVVIFLLLSLQAHAQLQERPLPAIRTDMQEVSWRASWIAIGYAEDTLLRPAQYFRKILRLSSPVRSARLLITSHGLYQARVNGLRVGDGCLSPGWTSYGKRLQYQAYEVGAALREGRNELCVTLGNGWYRGYIGWEGKKDHYGNTLSLLCQLEVTYADGVKDTIVSDGSWSCGPGRIGSNDLLGGVTVDATRNPEYRYRVTVEDHGYDRLVPDEGVRTTPHETFTPKLIVTPQGDQVLDFGQNLTGWVRVRATGNRGDTIILTHGEVLDPSGNFYRDNMRSAQAAATYILSGSGPEYFEPCFSYFGFRYVKVSGTKGSVNPADYTAVALYADMEPTGTFACSNPLLNQLHRNIVWGQKSNFTDVPTDCPQRDEKLGWTGDAQVFCRTATFNFDVRQFFSKWLNDLSLDQLPNGRVTHVVPDILGGVGGSAGWSDAATIVPWTLYEVYGDTALLERQYPSMKAWVDYIIGESRHDLWDTGMHYGDWLSYRSSANREYTAHTDMHLIAQAFYAHSTEILVRSAAVLGKTEDIRTYSALLGRIKAAFCREYLTPNGLISSNTQTAYALALHFDLLPEDKRAEAARRLVRNIGFYKDHLTTGFIGTPYLCHVLSRFGYVDVAYRLLLQETYPSWLYPITRGATTIWERWDGIRPDGSLQNPQMNSFNHYAYGAVGDWMYQHILGIQPGSPGYQKVLIKPLPGGGLSWAKGSYSTAYGEIGVDWRLTDGDFELDVEIPHGVTATIVIPGLEGSAPVSYEVGPGKHHYRNDKISQTQAQRPVDAVIRSLQRAGEDTGKNVLVVAHRGDWRNAPENSLLAIRNCIDMGVDIVEIDIKKTADGHLVVMHDTTLDRTTNGKGPVSSITLDSLKKLRLRNGYRLVTRHTVPTLEEAMLEAKGKVMVNLDHCYPYLKQAYAILEKTGTVDHVIFKGTKPTPDDIGPMTYMPIVVLKDSLDTERIQAFQTGSPPVAFELVFDQDSYRALDSLPAIHNSGSRLWANTLWPSLCGGRDDELAVDEADPEASWGWLIGKGFTIIQTDRPRELLAYLRGRGLHD